MPQTKRSEAEMLCKALATIAIATIMVTVLNRAKYWIAQPALPIPPKE
jgi:hypothetical protein